MDREVRGLPKSIEGATERYLNHYENNFVGSAADMYRLRDMARDFILKLRQIAPKFYDEKLPQLVNQAASTLLTFDTANEEELKNFHETHAYLLLILQDLRDSQPAGEISFHNEKKRFQERAHLIKRQAALAKAIDQLESMEFDYDELGEEDCDSKYAEVFNKMESLKREQRIVNTKLAYIEGEQIEEKPNFKLHVKPNSILNRLTEEQLRVLEGLMLKFYQEESAIYLDISTIDEMFEKLNLDKGKYQLEELRHMSKDALDSYKMYFRKKAQAARDEFHQELLNSDHLRPKDGIVIDDPNLLPDNVRQQLEKNSSICEQEMENLLDEYNLKQDQEQFVDEQVDGESDDEETNTNDIILTSLKARGVEFARVTEAPRDDFISGQQI